MLIINILHFNCYFLICIHLQKASIVLLMYCIISLLYVERWVFSSSISKRIYTNQTVVFYSVRCSLSQCFIAVSNNKGLFSHFALHPLPLSLSLSVFSICIFTYNSIHWALGMTMRMYNKRFNSKIRQNSEYKYR